MNDKILVQREGFWRDGDESILPMPRAIDKPWMGKREFLKALSKIQEKLATTRYKGYSKCRICGERNGNETYVHHNWMWPSGYSHYIDMHNVRPSLAFQEFVLGRHIE